MSDILVAKTYQEWEIAGAPFWENGRKYVTVISPKGEDRAVRVYSEREYERMYGKEKEYKVFKTQKELLGFSKGYITVFRGNTYPYKEWFKENGARFTRSFKWSFDSDVEIPEDIPEGLEPVRVEWEQVGNGDRLKTDDEIKKVMDNIFYASVDSLSEYVGEIGDRLELTVTVNKAITFDGYYGTSIMHIMEDGDGNVYVWTTSSKSFPEGKVVTIRGTVKDHREYRGVKQTILTRCKEISKEEDIVVDQLSNKVQLNNNQVVNSSSYTINYADAIAYSPSDNNLYAHGDVYIDGDLYLKGKKIITTQQKKEQKMNKKFNFNFDFGPIEEDAGIGIGPKGIAVKNLSSGAYCYYDPDKCEIVDCTPFTLENEKLIYKVPVPISAIAVGDIIMHNTIPVFVKGVEDEEGRLVVIDIDGCEEKYILPVKNLFGFNYVTKLVSLLDSNMCGASADMPFGNMLPFLMMQDNKELDPLMFLMMSGQNGNMIANMPQNPMLMYMMMSDKSNKDLLPFLLLTTSMKPQ